jgi:DNA-binding MarR family transcriptional regulator
MERTRVSTRGRDKTVQQPPLGRLLSQVERQLSRLVERALLGHGLNVDQWGVIDVLADGHGHSMSELAAAISVPGPTLTKIVDKLVDAALVYRLVDDRDRRRVLAFLSDKGMKLHSTLAPQVGAAEAEAVAVLGDDGVLLLELLTRFREAPAG